MILFEHDDKKYKLLFRYGIDKRGRRTTTAFVCHQGKNQPVLWEATATCSLEDNFCKNDGRRISIYRLDGEIQISGLMDKLMRAWIVDGLDQMIKKNKKEKINAISTEI